MAFTSNGVLTWSGSSRGSTKCRWDSDSDDVSPSLCIFFFNVFLFYFICFGFTGQKVVGVILEDGTKVTADAVVLTTGTFLRGVIQIGACGLRLLACSALY